jgi:hypothetical protein
VATKLFQGYALFLIGSEAFPDEVLEIF